MERDVFVGVFGGTKHTLDVPGTGRQRNARCQWRTRGRCVAGMVDSDVMEYIGGQLQVSKHYSSPPEHQQPQPTAQLRRGQLVEQFVGSGFGRSYTISSLRLAVG